MEKNITELYSVYLLEINHARFVRKVLSIISCSRGLHSKRSSTAHRELEYRRKKLDSWFADNFRTSACNSRGIANIGHKGVACT